MKADIFQTSNELKDARGKSHAFYIAKDIAKSKVFFPSKRIPIIVSAESTEGFVEAVEKLIACYGKEKNVSVFTLDNRSQFTLSQLKLKLKTFPVVLLIEAEDITSSKRFDFQDLIDIMLTLRSENGCKWDREQTHESIRINLIEEAYELVDAIDFADKDMMLEETGDVLLQAVFHTHIGMDNGSFDYGDVLTALCEKLLSRHTHIFGQNHADNIEDALNFWNEAKKQEKGYTSYSNAMELVPKNLPSLLYAYKIQKKAAKAGFDWKEIKGAIDKIGEELSEVLSANESDKEMEGGDLLFSVVNVLRHLGIEPELALKASAQKFLHRFELVEKELTKDGKEMSDFTLEEMDAVWNSVKLC